MDVPKTRDVSRRQAITTLSAISAGAIGGAIGAACGEPAPASSAAATVPAADQKAAAAPAASTVLCTIDRVVPAQGQYTASDGTTKKWAVLADGCCDSSRDTIAAGVKALQSLNTAHAGHLEPLITMVDAQKALDEHFFVAFGIPDKTLAALREAMRALFEPKKG